ncbi:hypothetical protein [Arcobacter sp. FWKO B]|uniref:hypothetical protein n=1 Tax=Arcobacter sp. FWKO B TaxID=2593672 RepID=UPI0018A69745|nr:hypothetical protein [Arcobacter sp. FWKO B]QOG12915.1 hypothetical protein FWKOB_09505 [Arcobacter sp. FWKO B]
MAGFLKLFYISIFSVLIFLPTQISAQTEEESIFESYMEEEQIQATEEIEVLNIFQEVEEQPEIILSRSNLTFNLRNENNIVLKYETYPTSLLKKQQFMLNLEATIATDNFEHIITTFEGGKNYEVLNKDSKWLWKRSHFFTNGFVFKVLGTDFKMPTIIVSLVQDEQIVEEFSIEPKAIKILEIGDSMENFTSVIASDLKIVSHFTRQYDNNSLLTLLELEATNSNLEDLYFKQYKKQGIESLSGDFKSKKLVYYAIVPLHLDRIMLSYYNTNTLRIETLTSPIVHTSDIVSTQTDLNPNTSEILLYQRVAAGVFVLLFGLYFLFKRNKISFVFFLIPLLFLAYLFLPNKKTYIGEGVNIFILPTKSSSVFYKTDKVIEVEVLQKSRGYVKILLPDKNIGWVNESDISKN